MLWPLLLVDAFILSVLIEFDTAGECSLVGWVNIMADKSFQAAPIGGCRRG